MAPSNHRSRQKIQIMIEQQTKNRQDNRDKRGKRDRRDKRDKKDKADKSSMDSKTVGVYRTAATVKGGRRFSFSAMVVVGDQKGTIGIGYGKATEVPSAIEKAEKVAKRSTKKVSLKEDTIPHEVMGRFGASYVKLVPASPGTGVIAGGTVRAVLEMVGVRDCLTKAYGSTNEKNLVKATLDGLLQLRMASDVERLRGVTIGKTLVDEMIERGRMFMPQAPVVKTTDDKEETAATKKKDTKPKTEKSEAPKSEKPAEAKKEDTKDDADKKTE